MTTNFNQILECFDSAGGQHVENNIFEALNVNPVEIDFFKKVTNSSHILCPGCEDRCPSMLINKLNGQQFIVCDKPKQYGKIILNNEDVIKWRLDLNCISDFIAKSLCDSESIEIIADRIYDLGLFERYNIFLVKGINWSDAQDILNDRRLCNPVFITLSTPPNWLEALSLWIGQIIIFNGELLEVDRDRLVSILPKNETALNNYKQQSKGGYNRHKETNLIKNNIVKTMFHNSLLIKGRSVRQKADKINDVLSSLVEMSDVEMSEIANKYSLDKLDLQIARNYFSDDKSERVYKWCLAFDKGIS